MIAARTAATAALLVAVLAGFAALVLLLVPADAGTGRQPATAPVAVEVEPAAVHDTAPAADGFLVALVGPGTDLDDTQAAAFLTAADRVCEGVTAQVPVAVMSTTLMGDLGLTGEEARHFVNTAATVHCAAR